MSSSTWRGDSPAPADQEAMSETGTDAQMHPDAPDMEARTEAKAARLHGLGRLRGKYFATPVMGDSAMSMMLSLFVGELQSRPVSNMTLAVGSMLSREETDLMIDRLVSAGLAVITGLEPNRRIVGLTPLGSARMRSFVNDYPNV